MERITQKHLEAVLARINSKAGFGEKPKFFTDGAYGIDWAYGGVKFVQYVGTGGGERNITNGYCPKRELYYQMQTFLSGMEANKA